MSNKHTYKKIWYKKTSNTKSSCKEVYNFKHSSQYGFEAFNLYFVEGVNDDKFLYLYIQTLF